MERFVLWHRILPPAFEEEETTAAAGQWARYVTGELEAAGAPWTPGRALPIE